MPGNIPVSRIETLVVGGKHLYLRMSTERKHRVKLPEDTDRLPEFDSQVLSHLDMLYAVAMRLTRNTADAQDLTQNTVLKALRFHRRFEKGTYMKAWLLTILRNTFINEYRRKVRHPTFVELTGMEPAPSVSKDPDIAIETRGTSYTDIIELLDDQVTAAIDGLPDEFRLAVIMADIEDKSYKEIADVMGCPLGTVMSRLYRGRKLLRRGLEEYAKEYGLSKNG